MQLVPSHVLGALKRKDNVELLRIV